MMEGMLKRVEYFGKLMGLYLGDIVFNFNFNRPTDNSVVVEDIRKQIEMGIMSKETGMAVSPYIVDVEEEKKLIDKNVADIEEK